MPARIGSSAGAHGTTGSHRQHRAIAWRRIDPRCRPLSSVMRTMGSWSLPPTTTGSARPGCIRTSSARARVARFSTWRVPARSFIGPQETDAVVLAGHSQGGHAALFAAGAGADLRRRPAGRRHGRNRPRRRHGRPGLGRRRRDSGSGPSPARTARDRGLARDARPRDRCGPHNRRCGSGGCADRRGWRVRSPHRSTKPNFIADPATLPEWQAAFEANTPGVPLPSRSPSPPSSSSRARQTASSPSTAASS